MSGLVNGRIPIGTVCPFRAECPSADTNCAHKGVEHKVAFSCGYARLFAIMGRNRDEILRSR